MPEETDKDAIIADHKDAIIADLIARLGRVEKLADPGGTIVARTCNVCGGAANEAGFCPTHPSEIVHGTDAKGVIIRSARGA